MDVVCSVCRAGTLKRKKVYRMNGVVVLIGYLIAIPSMFGMVAGGCAIVGGAATAVGPDYKKTQDEDREQIFAHLDEIGIPDAIVATLKGGGRVSESDLKLLPPKQETETRAAQIQLAGIEMLPATGAAVGLVGGSSGVCLIAASLVSGLLGYLLIQTKKILKCNACGAVVAAS